MLITESIANSKIFKKINRLPNEKYVFWITLIFYLLLLVMNPPNKFIALSFVPLLLIYYLKIKNFKESLLFTFISSGIIMTGKTYPIQMVPPDVFQTEVYPYGYIINIVISSSLFLAFAMLLFTIRELILKPRYFKPNFLDILLIIFYFLRILSAFLGSKEVSFSLPLEILGLSSFCAYFYVRIVIKMNNPLWKILSYLISAMVIFEAVLGVAQLASKSPLDKNIEYQINIEYYGRTIGETQFTFRPVGTFDHANSFGIWLAAVCIFLFASALKNRSNILWLAFFAGFAAMITTISRSSWLGFAAGFIFFISYNLKGLKKIPKIIFNLILKWRFVVIPCTIVLFFFFIIPRINDSFYSFRPDAGGSFFRKIQISDAIEIIKLHPIFGIGAGMGVYEGIALDLYTMASRIPLEIHNWYLNIALESGIPSLFVVLLFILCSIQNIFQSKTKSIVEASIIGVIFCSMTAGMFQPYSNFGFILLLLSLTNNGSISPSNARKNS